MSRIVKDHDERYAEFIATAQQLFFSQGYEPTTVRDIIEAVGVAKGTFYYYFDSKQDILEALVAELATQVMEQFEAIVANETLTAIEKWMQAMRVINDWKIARKDELLVYLRIIHADDNVLLAHKLQARSAAMTVPILAKIIAQGIREGVFETAYVEESAAITYATSRAMSDAVADLLLHPEAYDHPKADTLRKLAAMQTAIERMLGAAPGSLPIIDEQALTPWFEDRSA